MEEEKASRLTVIFIVLIFFVILLITFVLLGFDYYGDLWKLSSTFPETVWQGGGAGL